MRTALCIEPRQGRLHVFMPPTRRLEDYLALVAAVEETAAELGLPVLIEGYTPPHDFRLRNLRVTPDPGVIEVNMQPAHDWNELVDVTTALYDERTRSGWGQKSSCSTVAIRVRAAGITSSSVAQRQPTVRSCAGPICCAACSRTGKPAVAVVLVLRVVHRSDEPGPH